MTTESHGTPSDELIEAMARIVKRLKVCMPDRMCFQVDAQSMEPVTTAVFDPHCFSDPDGPTMSHGDWLNARAAMIASEPITAVPDMKRSVLALHEALGGDGWAYTNYGGNELETERSRLEAGVEAVLASINTSGEKLWDIVERLRAACVGHPHATVDWPHRILHEAADIITTLTSERDAAWNEAQCCDDTPLGQASLAEFIAVQHACRKAAEASLSSALIQVEALTRALEKATTALELAEERENRARFRASSPRLDQEVVHARTMAIAITREALRSLSKEGETP